MVVFNNFQVLLNMKRGQGFKAPERLLCLDPGHTTGWSLFENGNLTASGQVATMADGWPSIDDLFNDIQPTHVVFENYRVYAHKLDRHSNSEVYTLRLVGVIEYLCDVKFGIPRIDQMAHQAKGFVTDEKLKAWGFYKRGEKHARDAIRHGVYALLFSKELDTKEE